MRNEGMVVKEVEPLPPDLGWGGRANQGRTLPYLFENVATVMTEKQWQTKVSHV